MKRFWEEINESKNKKVILSEKIKKEEWQEQFRGQYKMIEIEHKEEVEGEYTKK